MNFIMTNVCNLHCPYCFASNITCDEYQFATEECLLDVIKIASRTKESIRLVGGEPTVHPNFLDLFKSVDSYNKIYAKTETVVFTNGILLNKYYPTLTQIGNFAGLINYNDLSQKSLDMQQNMDRSMRMLQDNDFRSVMLGCNIHLGEHEYNYIFDAIKRYEYKKVLRVSITTPTNEYSYFLNDIEAYFQKIKPTFFNFVHRCKEEGVTILLDCNKLPPCLISYDEALLLKEVCGDTYQNIFCNSCNKMDIDIDMNYNATRCFSTRDNKINIKSIKDSVTIEDIKKEFDKISSVDCKMNKEKTSVCIECSGGCNFFTKKED